MAQLFKNFARARIASSIGSSDTTIVLQSGYGAIFPEANMGTGPTGDWFKCVLEKATGEREIVAVRTRSSGSDILSNVLRAQEGTTAISFDANTVIGVRLTSEDVSAMLAPRVLVAGDTMTGPLQVPAGATGAQAPQVQEVVGKTAATGSAKMPVGTTAEWDVTPAAGFTRVNSETDQLEFHNGTDIVFTRKHQAARFATTSGTSFDITDIPDWVTQIDIVPRRVSLSGTDSILIQLGGASGFLVTGYSSTSIRVGISAASATGDTSTTGFVVSLGVAGNAWTGRITIHKVRDGSRAFVQDHTGKTSTSVSTYGAGDVVMTEELTQIRIKTDGANSFDAGEVIVYWS